MYNILISGYYGFDNIGDESILRTLVTSLRERIPDCSLTVLSHDPAATREKYGVEAVERMSPLAIARAVRRCDMLISGGGSLLQDVTSSKSLHYYLAIIRFAQLLGKKVFIYSQGIGPIEKDADRRATARALRRADGIVVRDERSAALLAEIGVPAERVVITADPVIRMKKTDKAVGETILRRAGVTQDGRPVVGWAIRERNRDSRFVAEVLRSIRWLKETYNAQSVLIPFHYEEDGEVCRHIASQLPDDTAVCLDEKYLSEDMLSIIGCMDLLVGVRLHSLIYAAIMGVPLIGISYDPKCTAFLNSVGLDKLSTRDGYTAEAFETEAARVLANGAEQTACVKRHMDELSRKLDTNEEMICAIMKDEKKTQPSAPRKNEKSGVRTAGAISIVFLLTLFAKLLGVVREMVQANIFGTGVDANLYTASYNSTLYLFTTVCYALCIAAVPILTKEFAADRRRGERAANNLMTVTLLGALVVVVLILMKKPTIPTFIAGIAAGAVMAMLCQGVSLHDILTVMYSGFSADTGSDVVNSMLNRGGFTSMLSTIGLLIAAGIFGAPLRTAGVVDVLLAFVERIAKTSRSMSLGVLILHAVFFTITGAYYVSYPVVGGMVKDLYPEYHLDRKNLMRTMLDTGTGLAPMVSWSTTGSYTATTLGVSNLAFAPFAPMLWLSIVFSAIYAVTGIGTAKAKED